ncbi:MAG: glycosyltransferase family 4 protein, partial [Pseudomonadota bacterium]
AGDQYLIPNPVADEFFRIKHEEKPGRILFAGRLYALKGVHDLIRAVSTLKVNHEWELVLAGSVHDREYVDYLKAEIAKSDLIKRVRFLGLLGPEEYRRNLQEAAILALPSYQETAPMVVTEAMACGVPVVATDVGGVKYQVVEGETGFIVEPGCTSQLADRLSLLLGNPLLRSQFGHAARKKAKGVFQSEQVADKTASVYHAAISKP